MGSGDDGGTFPSLHKSSAYPQGASACYRVQPESAGRCSWLTLLSESQATSSQPCVTVPGCPRLALVLSWEDSSLLTGHWNSSREVLEFGQPLSGRIVSGSPRPRGFRAEPCLQPHSSQGWIRIPSTPALSIMSLHAYLPSHICTPSTCLQTCRQAHAHTHTYPCHFEISLEV